MCVPIISRKRGQSSKGVTTAPAHAQPNQRRCAAVILMYLDIIPTSFHII